ncbi:MAG TPA: S41 family peptidase [Candidatus Eisenbacteria bacterium]|nr:S41 family peptidase [Candidatus Eisenbacteria bacterium]
MKGSVAAIVLLLLAMEAASTPARATAATPGAATPGAAAPAPGAVADTLSFEFADPSGAPAGWRVWMPPMRWDPGAPHGGRAAARIDRDSTSADDFSAFSREIPADFAGDTLELRGWLRTENVRGFAGLWLREDGRGGSVQFDNMEERHIAGTSPWTEYRVALPLESRARSIVFGGLLVGTGTAWMDEMRLLVDGKPIAEAPRVVRTPPGAETDHEFDAGSRLTERELLDARVENLALLGKVWGFLKVHHPRVAAGALNWDYELFRILPAVAKARTRDAAARAMVRWIDRVGMPPPCRPCATLSDSAVIAPSIGWIHSTSRLTRDLSTRLERIYRDRSTGDDAYYASLTGLSNPDFSNENGYKALDAPDAGYRLLALFRFWNVIEYWFPDRDLLREPWDGVLAEFIPKLLHAADRDAYRLAMIDLVVRIRDGHANVWNAIDVRPPRGGCRLPVALRPVGDRYVVGAFADSVRGPASRFRIGDVIRALDGAPLDSAAAAWAPHYAASNEPTRRREISRWATQGPCGACRVSVEREDGVHEILAQRDSSRTMNGRAGSTHDLPGPAFRRLADDVAYLKLSAVRAADAASYVQQAAGTRCFVIDIRNYPSEFVVFALGQHLVATPTPFVRFTRADLANPGAFFGMGPVVIEPAAPHYEGKIVILVDEATQSSAEYTSMAFRAVPGAIVVGSTTAGADGNVSTLRLPGGLGAAMSGLGVFYPDHTPTQQVGIVPDLVVHPTVEGIRAGHDEVLEAALKLALDREVRVPSAP